MMLWSIVDKTYEQSTMKGVQVKFISEVYFKYRSISWMYCKFDLQIMSISCVTIAIQVCPSVLCNSKLNFYSTHSTSTTIKEVPLVLLSHLRRWVLRSSNFAKGRSLWWTTSADFPSSQDIVCKSISLLQCPVAKWRHDDIESKNSMNVCQNLISANFGGVTYWDGYDGWLRQMRTKR